MDDALILKILRETKTIALVGASDRRDRPSHSVMAFLQGRGYRVYPVNPTLAGKQILGVQVHARLADIPEPIDLVDIFRRSKDVLPIVEEAIAVRAKFIWMQLGIVNETAAARARAAGLDVIMNRCPAIEYPRLAAQLTERA